MLPKQRTKGEEMRRSPTRSFARHASILVTRVVEGVVRNVNCRRSAPHDRKPRSHPEQYVAIFTSVREGLQITKHLHGSASPVQHDPRLDPVVLEHVDSLQQVVDRPGARLASGYLITMTVWDSDDDETHTLERSLEQAASRGACMTLSAAHPGPQYLCNVAMIHTRGRPPCRIIRNTHH